jgi:outer membrane protein OmpA-like peptidoglycan-associated protein
VYLEHPGEHIMAKTTRVSSGILLAGVALTALSACAERDPPVQQSSIDSAPPPAEIAPSPPPPAPPPPDPNEQLTQALDTLGAEQTERGRVVRLPSAQFEPGETSFEPADTQRLDRVVALLREHPEIQLVIEGYTDSRGTEAQNEKVAIERADAVRTALVERGITESRLRTVGVGEDKPIADNSTADGRQQNRRVELIFSDAQGRFASAAPATPSG